MKKINYYSINDGMGGIILAKNLKQAIKKVAWLYKPDTVKEIMNIIKESEKIDSYENVEYVCDKYKIAKKGENKKSKLIGFYE